LAAAKNAPRVGSDTPPVRGSFRFSAEVKSTEASKLAFIPTFGRIDATDAVS
jgi:hypothetical protein